MKADTLPPSVLVKIATLEQACIGLTTKLEASAAELQRLRIEARDLAPRTVHDEYEANRESERLIAEAQRLDAAIAAQIATCEAQERRLRSEERIIRDCKVFLHDLPSNAQLRVVEGYGGGNVDAIRAQIKEVQDEIAQLQRLPVPSADLAARIKAYVDALAARAQPVIKGIAEGETLSVMFPLRADADRITMSGFSDYEANALLMAAFMDGEALVARLTQAAYEGSITQGERDQRLRELQEQLTTLRYDEEASVCAALARGEDVNRSSTPAWAVLQVQVEREQQAAA